MKKTKIITFAHQKGGVGKSTIAFNVAKNLAKNKKVGVLDLDEQGSIYALKEIEPSLNIELIENIDTDYFDNKEIIIVDTPPYLNQNLGSIIKKSDIVIIPTKASVPDIIAIRYTINFVLEIKEKYNPDLKIGVLVNMEKPNLKINKEAINEIEKLGVKVIQSIGDRIIFNTSFINGGVLMSSNDKAKKEIEDLTKRIIKM